MIEPGYVRTMAAYNAWQNAQLSDILDGVDPDIVTKDRGAFFGSILATLNHILWGDMMWMSRFSQTVAAPEMGGTEGLQMHPTTATWSAERFRMDGVIKLWAEQLRVIDLRGPLKWHSGLYNRDFVLPMATCVTHFFTHQTHHRGQVHAMLTAAGLEAPVTDIIFMPEKS